MTRLQTRPGRGANPIPTGSKPTDTVIGSLFNPKDDDDKTDTESQDTPKDGLSAALLKEMGRGHWFSIPRAIRNCARHDGALKGGFEKEVSDEIARQTGKSTQGFHVPWGAPIPIERRNLTTQTGPGSITAQIPYLMMIDLLRPKLALARLGAQLVNLTEGEPSGQVRIPIKTSVATVSWVAEGNAAPSESNMNVIALTMTPRTATAYSDVTRRMIMEGQPGFDSLVIDDIMTGLAVAVDAAGINGLGTGGQPIGLFQLPFQRVTAGTDSGNGGTITYQNLCTMENVVGGFSGDAPMAARLGWLTSPNGRSTLRKTDMGGSTVTGKFCWKAHQHVINNELVTCEELLGHPAISTINAPQQLTEGSASTVTVLAFGNFNDCIVNTFGSFDVLVNPYLLTTNGVVRVSGFADVDVLFRRSGSFCVCDNILAL